MDSAHKPDLFKDRTYKINHVSSLKPCFWTVTARNSHVSNNAVKACSWFWKWQQKPQTSGNGMWKALMTRQRHAVNNNNNNKKTKTSLMFEVNIHAPLWLMSHWLSLLQQGVLDTSHFTGHTCRPTSHSHAITPSIWQAGQVNQQTS